VVSAAAAWKMCAYENLSLVVLHVHFLSSMAEYVPFAFWKSKEAFFARQHCSYVGKLVVSLLLLYSFPV